MTKLIALIPVALLVSGCALLGGGEIRTSSVVTGYPEVPGGYGLTCTKSTEGDTPDPFPDTDACMVEADRIRDQWISEHPGGTVLNILIDSERPVIVCAKGHLDDPDTARCETYPTPGSGQTLEASPAS